MRKILRISAAVLAAGAVLSWAGLGANRGWTRTSVAVKTIDEVTGIEGIEYKKRFVPGLELLGATLIMSGTLAATTFMLRKQSNKS